jgi:hypothetical protein
LCFATLDGVASPSGRQGQELSSTVPSVINSTYTVTRQTEDHRALIAQNRTDIGFHGVYGLHAVEKGWFGGQPINEMGGIFMSKQAAEHHHKAAEHHEHAALHHKEAAKHHEAGKHEMAAHHAHLARAHHEHATHHAVEAAKAHLQDHGKASPTHA